MSFQAYSPGVVDCNSDVDLANVKGKSVIVTGGAKGMGEDGVRAFVAAGAFVTFGDTDTVSGEKLARELGVNANFVRCDVTSWEDQLAMFKSAEAGSSKKAIDIVVANAGISGPDEAFNIEDEHVLSEVITSAIDSDEPSKPLLKILHTDLIGVIYTLKLARHYFMKHPLDAHHDRCFIVNGSLVGFLDVPGIPQYMASKWGCRALMRCVRRTTIIDGVRINLTGPWYVGTTILSPAVQEYCKSKNIVFAESADAAAAWLRIASNPNINGRSFAIVPREIASSGYFDIGKDDYDEGDLFNELQDILLRTSHRLQVKASDQ